MKCLTSLYLPFFFFSSFSFSFLYNHVYSFSSSIPSLSSSMQLCSHEESIALLEFNKTVSIGPLYVSAGCSIYPYPKTMSWKEGTDCCLWDGVTCDNVTGHVLSLDLSCSQIEVAIPSNSSLFLLSHLQTLNLAFNSIPNTSVADFGRLVNLVELDLSQSRFSGQVLPEISHLSKLVSLKLSGNSDLILGTLALEKMVHNMSRLQELALDFINMSSASLSSLRNLTSSLRSLRCTQCSLEGGLPVEVFQLPNLEELKLGGNMGMNGLFPQVNWGTNLKVLDVPLTNLSGRLPDAIGNLNSFKVFNLFSCRFQGPIPASLGNLTMIPELSLSYNEFSGNIPSSLSNLKQLQRLDLQNNNLNGQIPDMFSNMSNLSVLDLSGNVLVGPLPPSLGMLKNLTILNLYSNLITGAIPSGVYSLPLLSELDIHDNQLTGHIGDFQYTNLLRKLDMSGNRFYGSIPSSIFELKALQLLVFNSNNLSGTLELSRFSITLLGGLHLSYNSLSVVTGDTGNTFFPLFYSLGLAFCNLSKFPEFIRAQYKLAWLDLSGNKIHGQLPDLMAETGVKTLRSLNLSHNYLTRVKELPWNALEIVDLHANLIEGPLPLPPPAIRILVLSDNRFAGELSGFLCGMGILEVLNLSNNSLTGKLPECLGSFSYKFSALDLRKNRFHGSIPDTFSSGCSLKTLNLNRNELEGPIPRSLANCTMLEVLDLGNNKMNGTFPYWLGFLPYLRVLVLHSNQFQGTKTGYVSDIYFPKLRILDISNNKFNGTLRDLHFQYLKAMMAVDKGESEMQYLGQQYYQDSVVVTWKGLEIELVRILTIFSTIDLSENYLEGEIPMLVGDLQALKVLNFSHNQLIGSIPVSLKNLTELEALDVSSNNLTNEIPQQLTGLTFLSVLNLSYNHLSGPIPHGNQFNTFENDSYLGNLALCGPSLSTKCSSSEAPKEPPAGLQEEDDDDSYAFGFGWKVVLQGYACGLILGVVLGWLVFHTGKPHWIIKLTQ